MSVCFKCNKSIKPASLASTIKGERYHPTCITCEICDKQLWGRPFKTNDKGKLVCEQPCTPTARPQSAQKPSQPRPSSAQIQQQAIISEQEKQQADPSLYKKTLLNDSQQKQCKICNETVVNQRYITYENGDIACQHCHNQISAKIPRVKSAHFIACAVCNTTVRGTRYFTEPNGEKICEKCDLSGLRCPKCNLLFKLNDQRRSLNNGIELHEHCFECSACNIVIREKDFYESEQGLPMCMKCYQISKLPKCLSCGSHITTEYIIIDNKPMHNQCFKCTNCSSGLNKEVGYFRNKTSGGPICADCNVKLNGAKCARCLNVIEKEGVSFNSQDYHQDCFKCNTCSTALVKMKKTLTDKSGQGLFCEPCFIQNFSPKCNKCNQTISPYVPGTQYEDKHFHRECFACARCKRSLATTKFFKTGNILICEQCY